MPNIPDSYTLESQLNRTVVDTNELESTLQRGVTIDVEIESTLARTVVGDDPDVDPEVKREYVSFMNKAAMNKVQYDVLNQNLSLNPYFDQFLDDLDNAALRTKNQTIIKAINEIFTEQKKNFNAIYNGMKKFSTVVGDLTIDKTLKEKYSKIGARNIYSALVQLDGIIEELSNFVKGNEEDMTKWDTLGYESIVQSLDDIVPPVKRVSDLIAALSDEQLANIFSEQTADIGEALEELNSKITNLEETLNQAIEDVANNAHQELENTREELIDKMGKWGTLTDSDLADMLEALDVEKTDASDGVQVVHEIITKYQAMIDKITTIEEQLEEVIGRIDAWGTMTKEKATEMLLSLGVTKEDPTGLDVLETLLACFCDSLEDISNLNNRVTSIEETVEALGNRCDEVVNKLDILEEKVNGFEDQLNTVIETQKSDSDRITVIEEVIDGLPSVLQDLSNRLADVESKMKSIGDTIEFIDSELDDHEERIEALEAGHTVADDVNVRLTTLEEVADITLTQDMIATERDIRNLFENDREGD